MDGKFTFGESYYDMEIQAESHCSVARLTEMEKWGGGKKFFFFSYSIASGFMQARMEKDEEE